MTRQYNNLWKISNLVFFMKYFLLISFFLYINLTKPFTYEKIKYVNNTSYIIIFKHCKIVEKLVLEQKYIFSI